MRAYLTTMDWSRRLPLLLWLLAGLLIALQIAPRLGDGSWLNRTGLGDTVLLNGVRVDWEWVDVAQTALPAEGDKRWPERGGGFLFTQSASRFIPGLVYSWLMLWTRDLWRAAAVAIWLCWLIAAGAMYALGRALIPDYERGRDIGIVAAGFMVFSPGFTAHLNNVETQPFSYTAVVVALLAMQRSAVFGLSSFPGQVFRHVLALTLVLFITDATENVGAPLIAMMWLFYVGLNGGTSDLSLISRARRAALVTAGFIGLQACWWLVVQAVVLGRVASHNQPSRLIADFAGSIEGWQWLVDYVQVSIENITMAHAAPVVFLFVPGLVFLPRRAAVWVLIWSVIIVLGVTVTRSLPRTAYFTFPALYLAAAAAAEGLGRLAIPRWQRWQPKLLRWLIPVAIIGINVWVMLGDLRGDLTQAQRWFSG